MPNTKHEGHTEPSLASHAVSIWLCAIPAVWMFVSAFGYLAEALVAFAIFLPVSFWLCGFVECRNAGKMSGLDMAKSLGVLALPYALLVWYIYMDSTKYVPPGQ